MTSTFIKNAEWVVCISESWIYQIMRIFGYFNPSCYLRKLQIVKDNLYWTITDVSTTHVAPPGLARLPPMIYEKAPKNALKITHPISK